MDKETVAYDVPPAVVAEQQNRERRLLVPVLIAAVVVAAATALAFGAIALQDDTSAEDVGSFLSQAAPEVEKRVTEILDLLTNYDATNIDDVADRMGEISTGDFRKDYLGAFSSGLGSALEKVSASSRGQILSGPDVSFRTASEAVAIARVQQTVQNNEDPTGRTVVYVMEITLIDTPDAGWKADRVEILSTTET